MAAPPAAVRTELRAGVLGLPALLAQGIAHITPVFGMFFTWQFINSYAGVNTPLAFLFGVGVLAMVAVSLGQLASRLPSAGGYYTYVSRTIHPRAGFFIGWLYMLFDPIATGYVYSFAGLITEQVLKAQYGFDLPWWITALVGMVLTTFLSYRGIAISVNALVGATVIEIIIIMALAITGIAHPGPGGFNLSAFDLVHASGVNGIYLGVIFTIVAYSGWESSAPLAEESKNPRRSIPIALVGSILIMGALHTFNTWGIGLGWGTDDIKGLVASTDPPLFVLAHRLWGWGFIFIMLAFWNSAFAVSQAQFNTTTRMWFGMARTGALPAWLSKVHPKYLTPVNAIWAELVVTLLVGIGLSSWSVFGPDQPLFFFSYALGIALLFIYGAGNIGVIRFFLTERRDEFNWLLHLVFPVVSTAALAWATWNGVFPLPTASPLKYAPWLFVVWFVLGIVVLIVMKAMGKEQWFLRASETARDLRTESH